MHLYPDTLVKNNINNGLHVDTIGASWRNFIGRSGIRTNNYNSNSQKHQIIDPYALYVPVNSVNNQY